MGGGSIGLQFGAQSAEVMFVIMSEAGLEAIIDDQVKIGGDLSVAFGGFGSGREASVTTNLDADIYAFSIGEGVFLGAAFEGAVINRRDDWNYYYYGEGANAQTIVFEHRFSNPHADELRSALAQF
jgi:lipid-binding SYLF domain-containing protein